MGRRAGERCCWADWCARFTTQDSTEIVPCQHLTSWVLQLTENEGVAGSCGIEGSKKPVEWAFSGVECRKSGVEWQWATLGGARGRRESLLSSGEWRLCLWRLAREGFVGRAGESEVKQHYFSRVVNEVNVNALSIFNSVRAALVSS